MPLILQSNEAISDVSFLPFASLIQVYVRRYKCTRRTQVNLELCLLADELESVQQLSVRRMSVSQFEVPRRAECHERVVVLRIPEHDVDTRLLLRTVFSRAKSK